MKKTILREYARLIAKTGVATKKGDVVMIQAGLNQPEFITMLVDECYKLGAKKVSVDWSYQPLMKSNVRYCKEAVLGSLDEWQIKKWEHQAEVLPCKIYLVSENPDGLAGINQKKYASAMAKRSRIIKPIRAKMENRYQWCIAAVPGKEWAKKIFPGERASVAMEKLWEAILSTSRVNEDPIAAWADHNANLAAKCEYLNSLGIKELKYSSISGTNFRVGLLPDAIFMAGGERTLGSDIYFNPNIPSEEVFTSPRRGDADGIVYSSKPLSYEGQLIDNFSFRFENGKVVEAKAEKGEELLNTILSMDEGAAYLGECALVPQNSPICQSGLLFYNTLFDENAACHLAIGMGFADTIEGNHDMTLEQCRELGINDSMIHEDFMIGCASMNIDAITRDGKTVPVFRKGNWAF